MRLLVSICKVLQDAFESIPVDIGAVPESLTRPCFSVSLLNENNKIKSYNLYETDSVYQIVYYCNKTENSQENADELYLMKNKLTEIFLFSISLPLIKREGITEKQRCAKMGDLAFELKLSECALYAKLNLNLVEGINRVDAHELIEEVEIDTKLTTR